MAECEQKNKEETRAEKPGKIKTRRTSKYLRDMATSRRKVQVDAIHRALTSCHADDFERKTEDQLSARLDLLEANWTELVKEHLELMADAASSADRKAHEDIYAKSEVEFIDAKALLKRRIKEVRPPQVIQEQQQQMKAPQAIQVQVQNLDGGATVSNTWGTFSGDHAQWRTFRDRFRAAVHDNDTIKPVFKLQALQRSVKGAAARAMGIWKPVDANYAKAWNALCDIYEDSYMIVQSLLNKLFTIPRMESATNEGLRRIIDTVRESVEQLSDFVDTANWDPIIVFLVVERLDADTYVDWEKSRVNAKHQENNAEPEERAEGENDEVNDDNGDDDRAANDQHGERQIQLPSWNALKVFLNQRAQILSRAERRGENKGKIQRSQFHQTNNFRARPPATRVSGAAGGFQRDRSDLPACRVCEGDHGLFHCKEFGKLTLQTREARIAAWKLCRNCYSANHDHTQCPNFPCRRCPGKQYHNSTICPTREAEIRAALLNRANDGASTSRQADVRKRKHEESTNDAKNAKQK